MRYSPGSNGLVDTQAALLFTGWWKGKETKRKETKGNEPKGKERKGKERKGKERKGKDRTGKERKDKSALLGVITKPLYPEAARVLECNYCSNLCYIRPCRCNE